MGDVKTINGLAVAGIKTINGIAIANVKTWNGFPFSAGAFSPADFGADLAFWLKADAGLTLSGSNDVDAWADQGPNGRDFGWENIKPKFDAAYANGKEYVYADVLGMTLKSASFAQQYRSIFIIFKGSNTENSVSGSQSHLGNIYYQSAANYSQIGTDYANVLGIGSHYFGYNGASADIGAIDQNVNTLAFIQGASSTKTYFNGSLVANTSTDVNNITSEHFLFSAATWLYTFAGGIREIVNLNRQATGAEITNMHTYLNGRA